MNDHGLVDLNASRGPRIPPPPPDPRRGGLHGPPPPPNHHPGPMGPMVHPNMMHHPPAHVVPLDMRRGRINPHYDVRNENVTVESMREKLSDYTVVRLEKADEETFDEYGNLVGPTWQNCVRREIHDMSNTQAARRVRELDLTEKNVSEKKSSLIPAQQRQLESILDELTSIERDPRYQTVLVQLEHQLREIKDPNAIAYYDRKKHKVTVVKKPKSKRKTKYRRQSITAYFKRMPRDGENLQALLVERDRDRWFRDHPQPPMVVQQQQRPPNNRPGTPKPVAVPVKDVKKQIKPKKRDDSPRSSRSSFSSGSGWSSESDSEYTHPTSVSSDSRHNKHRRRGRSQSRSRSRLRLRPQYFGQEPLRRHSRSDDYMFGNAPHAPHPPPLIHQGPIADEQALADAYIRGLERGLDDAMAEPQQHQYRERLIEDRVPVRRVLVPRDELVRQMGAVSLDDDSAYDDYLEPNVVTVRRGPRPMYRRIPEEVGRDRFFRERARMAQRDLEDLGQSPVNPFRMSRPVF